MKSFPSCRCLGPCLALSPEYGFVLEDELGVCGCVLGILDVRSFAKRCQASWLPAMRDKYPTKGSNAYPFTQVNMWIHFRLSANCSLYMNVNIQMHTNIVRTSLNDSGTISRSQTESWSQVRVWTKSFILKISGLFLWQYKSRRQGCQRCKTQPG